GPGAAGVARGGGPRGGGARAWQGPREARAGVGCPRGPLQAEACGLRDQGGSSGGASRAGGQPETRPGGHWAPAPLPAALAGEDCLWYVDRNGSWQPGFNCEFSTFCCGTCYQRYCCRDPTLLITERQQKHCLAFSPKTIAGIASAVILFVAVVATTICCFLCSCCYLYRRRQQLQSPFEGQEIPMTGIPVQPVYPYPQDPKAGPVPPQPGFVYPPSAPAPQYPLYPAGPPVYNPAAPPPYMPPQPSHPGA
uniref:Shisa family member 4 n=1 Tax=Catagonus wagneri TaxID=51154 RepID=A0A8C3WCB9_9CETA